MDLETIELSQLEDKERLEKVLEEAYEWGKHRGKCSFIGDRYGMMGGPTFDGVLKDYLKEKFQIQGSLIEISKALPQVPDAVIKRLEEGFRNGYREASITDDDS